MSYSLLAGSLTPEQVEPLIRALDRIAHTPTDVRPGHVEYVSKSDLVKTAQDAMSALPVRAE